MFQVTLVREPLDSYRSRLSGILSGLSALSPETDVQRRYRDSLFSSIDAARNDGSNRPILRLEVYKQLAKADGSPRLFIRTADGISSLRVSPF